MKKLGDLTRDDTPELKGVGGGEASLETRCKGGNPRWAKKLSLAKSEYHTRKGFADANAEAHPAKAAYQYARAANYAKTCFEILLRQNVPLDEKLDMGKQWWEAHKLAADTAPVTKQKHAAYNRRFEGSAAAAIFEFINPLGGVYRQDKILWAERWYSGCKEGADMLIGIDKETAWCLYWSAKNAAEVLWGKKKRNLKTSENLYDSWVLLIKASDSYGDFIAACNGAEFMASYLHGTTGIDSWREKAEELKKAISTIAPHSTNIDKLKSSLSSVLY